MAFEVAQTGHSAGSAAEIQSVVVVAALESLWAAALVATQLAVAAGVQCIEVVAGIDSAAAVALDSPSPAVAFLQCLDIRCTVAALEPDRIQVAERHTVAAALGKTVAVDHIAVVLGER